MKYGSTTNLDPAEIWTQIFFYDLALLWLAPPLKKLQNYGGFVQNDQQTLELCSIEGCQCYICVTLDFGAKVPLAQRQLLVEVPSLRVICKSALRARGKPSTMVAAGVDS